MIEVFYPNNDGPEKPKESVIDEMNSILAENTKNGGTMPTVQKIAEALGVDASTYHQMARNDEKFIDQIRQYLSFHNSGLPGAYENRLDAVMVAINVIEAHQRFLKQNTG